MGKTYKNVELERARCPECFIKSTYDKLIFFSGLSQFRYIVTCFLHTLGTVNRRPSKGHFYSHTFPLALTKCHCFSKLLPET